MRKSLFLRIVDEVSARNSYFIQKRNASGDKGFTPIHKCLVAMRMLAYGGSADGLDDTYAMAETTVIDTLFEFVETVIDLYEKEYLRPPRARELEVILRQNEARGFPGMIGSIDCMHWQWENCPSVQQRHQQAHVDSLVYQYQGLRFLSFYHSTSVHAAICSSSVQMSMTLCPHTI